jgi:uncharacterized RDD family membrane protein YckC
MNGHALNALERKIVIRTPENLEVSYELAGAGTRAAAYVVDSVLMMAILSVLQNAFVALFSALGEEMQVYAVAVLGLIGFMYFNGYFIVFELLWAGQSPGKRLLGLRVIKTGGYALRFPDTLIRNLLRSIDFIPVMYGVGLTSLLFTRRCQRIGDVVAGTLVVYQESAETGDELLPSASEMSPSTPLPVVKLGLIPTNVVEISDEFLRAKDQLAPKFRQQFASDLLELIERLSGLIPPANQSAEAFLLSVVRQCGQIPVVT